MAGIYTVVVTKGAKENLREIVQYVAENGSYEQAKKVRDRIEEEIAKLADMPESKGLLRGLKKNTTVYRRVLVWSYRIIFTIEEKDLLVLVVRIDHQKSNPDKLKNLP